MKEKFFIFLDIDGVMQDWDYIKSFGKKNRCINVFNPESVEALNYLIETLLNKYNVEIVVTSSWRTFWEETILMLKKNNVNVSDVTLSKTIITNTPEKRGEEILDFFNKNGYTNNFVIIDDEMFDYQDYFPKEKIIKTSLYNKSLRKDMVKSFFKNNKIYNDEILIK